MKTLTLLASLLLAAGGLSCRNWDHFPWWYAVSPGGGNAIAMQTEVGGLGGDTYRLIIYSTETARPLEPGNQRLLFRIHSCFPIYAFWLDDRTVEVQIDPANPACRDNNGTVYPDESVQVIVTHPLNTAKGSIMATSPGGG